MHKNKAKPKNPDVEIIPAPDDLRRKVGGGRPQNPKATEAVLDAMNNVMETQKDAYEKIVRDAVARFQRVAGNHGLPAEARMRQMRTVAHDLRGIAGSFGYVLAGRIANSFCDYVAAVDDGATANPEIEKLHADAIQRALSTLGPLDATSLAVLDGLRHIVAKAVQKPHH